MKNKLIRISIFLFLGFFFLFFSNGRINIAVATWLFPIFLLQVSRKEKKVYSYLIIPILFGIVTQISFWKFSFSNPKYFLFYIPFVFGILMGLIFYLDRFLYPKIKGFKATLVFPLIYTSFDFLINIFNPFGTTGILGYSQIEFLSFSQLASITGMWGLTFMITWFAAVIYWYFDNQSQKQAAYRGLYIYLSVLIPILIYGGIRLTIPTENGSVKIAGIHAHDKNIEGHEMWKHLNKHDTITFKSINEKIIQNLIIQTKLEANAGAKIIIWSEISFFIFKSDENRLITKFKELAKKEKIYLLATPFVLNENSKAENKTLLFSPNGNLVLTHYKFGGNFLEGTVEGSNQIKTIDTEYGKLSSVICWDGDFPSIIKQIGKMNTDILLIPASDWKEIDPLHSTVAVYRGIENGCSVVRQTRNGLSIITDQKGRTITKMDHFSTDSWVMNGFVPNKKLWTLYPIIGDLFGWLSIFGIFIFLYWGIFKSKN